VKLMCGRRDFHPGCLHVDRDETAYLSFMGRTEFILSFDGREGMQSPELKRARI
jgi:hypothetical protein